MADYGLAAQIGRGGGGGAVAQVDPLNRMTQLMKLQNLQQNMLLAQEAETRAKEMFGLQKGQIGQSMGIARAQEERARAMHVPSLASARAQAHAAEIAARRAEVDERTANKVWEVYQTADDPYNPEVIKNLRKTDARAASELEKLAAARNKAASDAAKSNIEAQVARFGLNKPLASHLAAVMPTINDQTSYSLARRRFIENNPDQQGAIPEEYTPENKKLFSGVLDRLRSMEIKVLSSGDIVGIDPIAGTMRYLTEEGTSQPVAMPTTRAEGPPATTVAEAPSAAAAPPNAMAGPPVQPPTNAMVTPLTPGQQRAATKKQVETEAGERGKRAVKVGEEAGRLDVAIDELDGLLKPGSILDQATGSGFGAMLDAAGRFVGYATPGAKATAALGPIASKILMEVPRFEGPQSDADVKVYKEAAGRLADPTVTVAERRSAAEQIRRLMLKRRDQIAASGAAKPRAQTQIRAQLIDPKTVRVPDGQQFSFPTEAQAKEFLKRIGQ